MALPEPIPYSLDGDAGIRSNGDFDHAGAALDFGTPGIGPFGPVFLQRIAFRIEVNPKQSQCVPKVGIERIDLYEIYRSLGIEPPSDWPRYGEIDHGVPTFALCGEVGLTGGPTILGAAAIRMNAGLGVATYADRPTVFRAFGKLHVVEIPLAKAAFELHTDGYVKARADFAFAIPDIVSLEGFLKFEMLKAKFNAEAYVRACVDLVDLCAGARGLISSKGIAVCLHVEVLGGEWSPGFGYEWGDVFPTPYFTGCDVGDYREHIVHASVSRLRGRAAQAQQAIDLPAGLPGAVIVAEGKDAPPKITLVGPNGERITTPDGMKAVQQKPFLLMKNMAGKVTQIAIGKPAAGRWQVIVEDGSSEVVSIRSAQGLPEPEVQRARHGARTQAGDRLPARAARRPAGELRRARRQRRHDHRRGHGRRGARAVLACRRQGRAARDRRDRQAGRPGPRRDHRRALPGARPAASRPSARPARQAARRDPAAGLEGGASGRRP